MDAFRTSPDQGEGTETTTATEAARTRYGVATHSSRNRISIHESSPRAEPSETSPSPRSRPKNFPSIRVSYRKMIRGFFTNVWETKVAVKLFGSVKELEKEVERLKTISYWVIHPCSKFRYKKAKLQALGYIH